MKEYYRKAGIATARYHMVDDLNGCRAFIKQVGYPVVVKPDNGVGASDTHKLSNDEELKTFLACKAEDHPDVAYIMEEFVRAEGGIFGYHLVDNLVIAIIDYGLCVMEEDEFLPAFCL